MKNLQALLQNWVAKDIVYSVNDVNKGVQMSLRQRVAVSDINAGVFVLLPAIPSFGYRLIDAGAIAVGGAAGGSTTLDIVGTLTTARKLIAMAVAGLTQSAILRAGAASSTVLADGASFTRNDINTPIVLSVTGAALSGVTVVDVFLEYVVEHE